MKWRLLRNRHWWYAHRSDLPSLAGILALMLWVGMVFMVGDYWEAKRVAVLSDLAVIEKEAFIQRLLAGINKKDVSLGIVTDDDGSQWSVHCDRYERRVGPYPIKPLPPLK